MKVGWVFQCVPDGPKPVRKLYVLAEGDWDGVRVPDTAIERSRGPGHSFNHPEGGPHVNGLGLREARGKLNTQTYAALLRLALQRHDDAQRHDPEPGWVRVADFCQLPLWDITTKSAASTLRQMLGDNFERLPGAEEDKSDTRWRIKMEVAVAVLPEHGLQAIREWLFSRAGAAAPPTCLGATRDAGAGAGHERAAERADPSTAHAQADPEPDALVGDLVSHPTADHPADLVSPLRVPLEPEIGSPTSRSPGSLGRGKATGDGAENLSPSALTGPGGRSAETALPASEPPTLVEAAPGSAPPLLPMSANRGVTPGRISTARTHQPPQPTANRSRCAGRRRQRLDSPVTAAVMPEYVGVLVEERGNCLREVSFKN